MYAEVRDLEALLSSRETLYFLWVLVLMSCETLQDQYFWYYSEKQKYSCLKEETAVLQWGFQDSIWHVNLHEGNVCTNHYILS